MVKWLKSFCVVLAAVLLLSGCGKQGGNPPEETAPQVTLASELTGPLSLGDKMPELTVTTADGTVTLSQLLEQKKMVMLNFWFADCIWCRREFPAMEVSYQKYKQDIEILALNPYDSQADITRFQEENSLSFPMSPCSEELAYALGVNGYPTSVVIDRDGTICLIHPGAVTDTAVFDALFQTYTAPDYTPTIMNSLSQLFE